MSVQELAKLAVRAILIGGAGLALAAPSAGARPITDLPMHPTAPARQTTLVPAPQTRWLSRDDFAISGSAAANPSPTRHTTPATPQAASGGFDWATAAIGGAALAGVIGLIWLSAAAISRATRTRVAN